MAFLTLYSLLLEQLRVLYGAETHLTKALPRLIEGVASSELKSLLTQHLEETENHIERLDIVATQLHEKLAGQRCRMVEGLMREASELTERRGDESVLDAAVIGVMRIVEGYERSSYEVVRELLEVLGEAEALKAIDRNLLDENRCEQSMTVLFEDIIDSIHESAHHAPSPAASEESPSVG
jgi:ferritin-like metal-binding protein YciE